MIPKAWEHLQEPIYKAGKLRAIVVFEVLDVQPDAEQWKVVINGRTRKRLDTDNLHHEIPAGTAAE
jgi:hypothetical protein